MIHQTNLGAVRAELNENYLASVHSPELESELEVSLEWHKYGIVNVVHCTYIVSVAAFSSFHSSKIFCRVGPS